ncbi:MAG: hypothetical protein P8P74_07000 [Crocinitomicaceae bacterium]|nr:hypothetical protein [Crocinitomicaceae bacterium]
MRILILFVGLSLLLSSCEKEVFDLSEDVSIGYKSDILVETDGSGQINVKYTELVSESRCPPDAVCIWEGYVKVKLKLDNEQDVELGLGETTIDSVTYNNHVIKLLAVDYDTDDDFGDAKKSSVVIRVD